MTEIYRYSRFGKMVLAFTLAALTCTFIQANIPFLDRDWVLLLFSLLVLLVYGFHLKDNSGLEYLCFYSVIVIINFITGDHYFSSFSQIVCEITMLFVSIVFYNLMKRSDEGSIKLLLLTFLLSLIVTAIGTYIAEQEMPGIIRTIQSYTSKGGQPETIKQLSRMGMTNYSLPHALPILLPVCVLCLKDRSIPKLVRYISIVALFSSLAIIYYSGATTPVLFAIVAIVVSLIAKVGDVSSNISRIIVLLFLTLFFIITKEYIALFFQYLSDMISDFGGSHSLVERLDELHTYILTGETGEDLGARVEKYNSTTSIYSGNIILGVDDESYGGHSALLDRLAVLGLVGFIPFIAFLGIQIKLFYKTLIPSYHMSYIICLIIALLTIFTKNMFSREFCIILLLVVPLSLQYIQVKSKNTRF